MFDSLDEQIKREHDKEGSSKQRMMLYVIYALTGVLVFGGVIYGIHLMS